MNEKKKMEVIQRWLQKAESDVKAAKYLLKVEDAPTDVICFHCQQAIEKYLKAYLTFRDIRVMKIHDLEVLLNMCVEKDRAFESLEKDKISSLSSFATEVRYPDEFYIPSAEEAKESFELALKVKDFVLKKLGLKASPDQ
jgi:HEPN domain-containing protein